MTPQDPSRDLFERRMRQRRAATCVVSARTAWAEGRTLEAVERLEEACRLDPEALEARLLLEQIRAEEASELPDLMPEEPADAAGFGKWSHWVAAVIAVAALAALALLRQPGADESRAVRPRERARPATATEAPAAAQANPAPGLPGLADSRNTVPVVIRPEASPPVALSQPAAGGERGGGAVGTGGTAVQPGRAAGEANVAAVTGATAEAEATVPTAARPEAGPPGASTTPPVERPVVTGAGAEPLQVAGGARIVEPAGPPAKTSVTPPAQTAAGGVRAPAPPVPAAMGVSLAPVEAAARSDAAAASRATDPAPASYRSPSADEEQIGRTLQLYADAYQRLDASAARKVWPSVDERALARAFAGLESQGLTFERCETEVDGVEALAVCRGRARYVPKVGSREPLTASRQWTFRMHRAGEGWQIASAEVR